MCEATVSWPLRGYNGLLGRVQLVGRASPLAPERRFEIDPLAIFEGLETPFAFYGLEPTLFDGPSRRDRDQVLDWLAHSFLCVSPTEAMDRNVEAVVGFSWGFVMRHGEVAIVPPEQLSLQDWDAHLELLQRAFPTWSFTSSHPTDDAQAAN